MALFVQIVRGAQFFFPLGVLWLVSPVHLVTGGRSSPAMIPSLWQSSANTNPVT